MPCTIQLGFFWFLLLAIEPKQFPFLIWNWCKRCRRWNEQKYSHLFLFIYLNRKESLDWALFSFSLSLSLYNTCHNCNIRIWISINSLILLIRRFRDCFFLLLHFLLHFSSDPIPKYKNGHIPFSNVDDTTDDRYGACPLYIFMVISSHIAV